MPAAMAKTGWKFLDLDQPLVPQIQELAEEDPELFGLDENGNELSAEEDTEDDTLMTPSEALVDRLKPPAPKPAEGQTTAQALASGFVRDRRPRPSNASASARKIAEIARRGRGHGVGHSADR
ncbi:hypothetical protein [Streptomyces sp. NBC_00035]|uniref:hypothetical protein n=1 Tax=Streptomyces sp. NBC_00035 TaxID=2903614 RepID=UPI003251A3E8